MLVVSNNFLAANVFLFASKNDYHRKCRRTLGALFHLQIIIFFLSKSFFCTSPTINLRYYEYKYAYSIIYRYKLFYVDAVKFDTIVVIVKK